MAKKESKKYKTGLVLSGGGTRGFAHLGVLKALNENDIYPDIISAVSAGAIAGALYADGKKPVDILNILRSKKIYNYVNIFFPNKGLVKMTGFTKTLRNNLKAKNIEDLEIPLLIHAVNINKGVYTCFDKGELVPAISASASIPVMFPPVKIDDNLYLDGGIINNFPLDSIKEKCERIIGVNLNPIGESYDLNSLKKVAERAFHVSLKSHTIGVKEKCDIYIEPGNLETFGIMDLPKARQIFDIGYEEAKKVLKKAGV